MKPKPKPKPKTSRLRDLASRWTKVLSAYFAAQGVTQLAGLLAAFLLVRCLPVREFALYALATSFVTFFAFVSDLGSTSSLLYFFHATRERPEEFERYYAAVLGLRRIAFALGALLVLVGFPSNALRQGFSATEALLAAAAILAGVWFQISSSVRLLALRLDNRYARSYAAEMAGGVTRLATTGLLIVAQQLSGVLATLTNALGALATALVARGREHGGAGACEPAASAPLAPYRRQVVRYLIPTLPSALYFSIQGPLVIWLAATFGSTRNIAEIGALGRLGLLIGLLAPLSGTILLPRLAQIRDERLWRRRYVAFGALIALLGGALVAASAVAPRALLWILGAQYSGLERELLVVMLTSAVTLLGGYAVAVNLARSWNRFQGGATLALALAQAALVALLPLGTTAGVLRFNLLSAVVGLGLQLATTAIGCVRPEWVRWMR